MKWIYDSALITRQVIAWTILIAVWGILIYNIVKVVPYQFVAIPLAIIAIPVVWQFFFSHRAVMKSMGARIITREQDPRLYGMVEKLAKQAGLPMPKVAVVNTTLPNAFATGRSKNRSVVAVTRGLYSYLNDDELEAVLAHELSHVKNADMATMTVTTFLSTVALLVLMGLAAWAEESSKPHEKDPNIDEDMAAIGEGIIILVVGVIAGLLYLLTCILMNLLSRYRELAADRGSVLITGDGESLISALTKIENGVGMTPRSEIPDSSACNMFYIIPALREKSFFNLFSTHPTLEKRIRNIREFAAEQQATIRENRQQLQRIAAPAKNRQTYRNPAPPQTVENRQARKRQRKEEHRRNRGYAVYAQAVDTLIGTRTAPPDRARGIRLMEEACRFHSPEAAGFLHSNHRETDLYLEGARLGNPIALDKVANWYHYDRTRIPEKTWKAYADVVDRITPVRTTREDPPLPDRAAFDRAKNDAAFAREQGDRFFRDAVGIFCGTPGHPPDHAEGYRYLMFAKAFGNEDAKRITRTRDRDAAMYLAGAKMDNDMAITVVSRWRYEDVDRLSLANLVEYGDIARKVRRRW